MLIHSPYTTLLAFDPAHTAPLRLALAIHRPDPDPANAIFRFDAPAQNRLGLCEA
jgi:hypothetical protein